MRLDDVLVPNGPAVVAICQSSDVDLYDGRFNRQGDVGHHGLHALDVGS